MAEKYATYHNLFLIWIQISVICLIISEKVWHLTGRLAFTWQGKRLKSGYFLSSGLTRSLIPEALWFISHLCIRLTRSIYEIYIFNKVINVKVLKMFILTNINQILSHILHLYNCFFLIITLLMLTLFCFDALCYVVILYVGLNQVKIPIWSCELKCWHLF